MRVAQVVLDIPTQALESAYTYEVPDEAGPVEVGCAVLVPFGPRRAIGFVMELHDNVEPESLGLDPGKIKSIKEVLSRSFFNEDGAACANYLAHEYLAPLSSCVHLFTPPGGVPRMKQVGKRWVVESPSVGEVDERWVRLAPGSAGFEPSKTAVKQAAIVKALRRGELKVSDLTAEFGSVSSQLKALASKGVIEIELRRRMRGAEAALDEAQGATYTAMRFDSAPKPKLTQGQECALGAIEKALGARNGSVVVVDGVTGSGKTEVYLRAIEQVVAAGQTAIVLVPEISLTPQTVARFRSRFGDMVAVMHSRMSRGERYDQWDFVRSGAARVVVGARSALFTPVSNLGLIVIDEEHEGSYKQDSAPRYVSRDVACWMAKRSGAAVVLGSATPSIETLHRAQTRDNWSIVELPERANGKPLPEIEVVDMAGEFSGGSRSMFSKRLQDALHEILLAKNKAVLMLNQRGFAKFVLCRECGHVPTCPECSVSLTYHEKGNKLVCHHCGYAVPTPPRCPECESPYLRKFGAGTQRVEAELVDVVASFGDVDAPVIRMDADTTAGKGAHQALLDKFAAADAAVLLGTQMIAKGLDFDDVTLVGVVNADTQLKLPDFSAAERTFNLIEQVAGRAGRADLPGRVIVQTYNAHATPIRAAARYDRNMFLNEELSNRRILKYPPFVRLADVLVWGGNQEAVRQEAENLGRAIEEQVRAQSLYSWIVLPATPCVLERVSGAWRYHIVIKAPEQSALADVLAPVIRARKAVKGISVAVDVDPVSLL